MDWSYLDRLGLNKERQASQAQGTCHMSHVSTSTNEEFPKNIILGCDPLIDLWSLWMAFIHLENNLPATFDLKESFCSSYIARNLQWHMGASLNHVDASITRT